jgi:hypothetical protein
MDASAGNPSPFRFCRNLFIAEHTGVTVRSIPELLTALAMIPDASLYSHTYYFLHRYPQLFPSVTNEFSYWITQVLAEESLGNELSAIDFNRCADLAYLREYFMQTLTDFVHKNRHNCKTVSDYEALPITAVRWQTMPASCVAGTLQDFAQCLGQADTASLLFHMYESRLRLTSGSNDFSLWIEHACGNKELAGTIASLNLNIQSFTSLKDRICSLITAEMESPKNHVCV